MTVAELITLLRQQPNKKAKCYTLYNGAARGSIDCGWTAREGHVVLGPKSEPVYDDDDRPVSAPMAKEEPYWRFEDTVGQ